MLHLFLLLCLYPCRCFQSCLNSCRLNSQVLRTFMDAFQGCYKFEPYDCRYWAAFYLFLRIAALAIFAATQSGYFVVVGGIMLIPVIILFAVIRPYRKTVYNVVDIVLLLAFVQVFFFSCWNITLYIQSKISRLCNPNAGNWPSHAHFVHHYSGCV